MAQTGNYTIEYTPNGLDYVRRVLGTRPYDEAGPLIAELEQQRAAQDKQRAEGLPEGAARALEAIVAAGGLNGAGALPAAS